MCSSYFALIFSVFFSTLNTAYTTDTNNKPNVILLVLDNWGFNDVAWHKNTDTAMNFLKEFVKNEALIIDTHYSYPLSSITRSALMTGRYPIRYGLQSSNIENGYPYGLSIFEKIVPGELKEHGYHTIAVGKWELGFHRPDMCPLQRGFVQFRGSLSPALSYYTHEYSVTVNGQTYTGHDLQIDGQTVNDTETSQYLTHFLQKEFMHVVSHLVDDAQAKDHPFFIYLAMHGSHEKIEVTQKCLDPYMDKLNKLTDCMTKFNQDVLLSRISACSKRVGTQALATCTDEALKSMINHLKSYDGVWENTLLIGLSDNGAELSSGDNYPLRGGKGYLFEGGVRTPAFVAGGYLNDNRKGLKFQSSTVIHVTDWYPTILSAIGLSDDQIFNKKRERSLDGKNMWNAIQYGTKDIAADVERDFLYNVDSYECSSDKVCGAYRYGKYKLIAASNVNADNAFWTSKYALRARDTAQFMDYLGCGEVPPEVQTTALFGEEKYLSLPCSNQPCMFDIAADPCEYFDLSGYSEYNHLYQYMNNMLLAYDDIATRPLIEYYADSFDTESDPSLEKNNGQWTSWMRNYAQNGEIIDFEFEQILMVNDYNDKMRARNGIEYEDKDVKQSKYYKLAMKHLQKYKSQMSAANDESEENKSIVFSQHSKEFLNTLKWMSITVSAMILVGGLLLCVKWYLYCMYGVNESRVRNRNKKMEAGTEIQPLLHTVNKRNKTVHILPKYVIHQV